MDKSVPRVTVLHHSADLVMPNSYPWDRFVHPYLALMSDSYILCYSGTECSHCFFPYRNIEDKTKRTWMHYCLGKILYLKVIPAYLMKKYKLIQDYGKGLKERI